MLVDELTGDDAAEKAAFDEGAKEGMDRIMRGQGEDKHALSRVRAQRDEANDRILKLEQERDEENARCIRLQLDKAGLVATVKVAISRLANPSIDRRGVAKMLTVALTRAAKLGAPTCPGCFKTTELEEVTMYHDNHEDIEPMYRCGYCGMYFSSDVELAS